MEEDKWEGKASVEVERLTVDQVWCCLEDFCNIHKWFPHLDSCYQVEGEAGHPGLVRCVASTKPSSRFNEGSTSNSSSRWTKEKLLMINPIDKCLSYEVLDNSNRVKFYVATVKLFPVDVD
ncbi:hypothetical protein Pint_12861 [Pistacia integerrima]|uniref:Uncharacterized protein n=1 Tax=Pistacia integerrima TaxID=434235 RepID=A0ACC0Y6E1_9ROSI|nr:hypothetical protein Pint_12861 [Pistacia integerrima]